MGFNRFIFHRKELIFIQHPFIKDDSIVKSSFGFIEFNARYITQNFFHDSASGTNRCICRDPIIFISRVTHNFWYGKLR
tara:strand:+ start:1076 stop:1312 length:237 start_codon:yes stop_codon:yes gene_type:complete